MKVDKLIKTLKASGDDVYQSWQRYARKAGCLKRHSPTREDVRKTFDCFLSAVESSTDKPQSARSARNSTGTHAPQKEIVADARRRRDGGTTLEGFLGCFKSLVCAVEDQVSRIDLNPTERTAVLLRLRGVADVIETLVVGDWEGSRAAGNGREGGALEGDIAQETSEKILSAIFMSVGEGILLVDEDFEIVKANRRACEIYGLLEPNLVGADIRSLTDSSGAEVLTGYFKALFEGQRTSAEITSLYVDGKTFPATVTVTRSDFDGKRYWPIIVRDDTDQKTLEKQLRQEKQQMDDMNLTLKTVMKSIEQDRKDFENRVASKIRASLLPGLKKIDGAPDAGVRKSYLALLEDQLLSLTAGFEKQLDAGLLKLTKTEIEVCRLIKAGCSSKDICDAMKLSFETVQTHRKNIRRKLDLNGKKLNLHAFLMNKAL